MLNTEPHLIYLNKLGRVDLGFVSVGEFSKHIPFQIERTFWVYGVPGKMRRGEHSHRELSQVLFALAGEIHIGLENITGKKTRYVLDDPSIGLFVPKLQWGSIDFNEGSVLLSLCSLPYCEAEYIRSYDEFKELSRTLLNAKHLQL